MVKEVVCLLNGITDVALNDLEGATPLAKAHRPNLDRCAREGHCLLVKPPRHGGFASSLAALLGESDHLDRLSSGPLEAYAQGEAVDASQVAYSVQLVSTSGETIIDVGRWLVSDREGAELCRLLNEHFEDEGFHFIHIAGARAVLIAEATRFPRRTSRKRLSPTDVVGRHWKEVLPARSTIIEGWVQQMMNLLVSSEINGMRCDLGEMPANGLWLVEGGGPPPWANQKEYAGKRTLLYTASSVSMGLARSLKVSTRHLVESNKYEALEVVLARITQDLQEYDRVIIEVPYIWESTYKGDLLEKIKTIEWLDRHLLGPLVERCRKASAKLIITTLRQVDIRSGKTTTAAVPYLCFPKKVRGANLASFDERAFDTLSKRSKLFHQLSTSDD